MAQRIRALQNEQTAKRDVAALNAKWDPKELRALARTAHELFGDRGIVEIDPTSAGMIAKVGQRLSSGPRVPGRLSKARWFFQGATHREITDQIALYRKHRS